MRADGQPENPVAENSVTEIALPFVSILMPVRNEAARIAASLGAVLAQDLPADRFEVLVVDGRSEDGTREIVQRIADRSSVTVRLLDNPERIAATALNRGIDEARGDIVVRIDGHAEPTASYVRRIVEVLVTTGAECVGGALVTEGDGPAGQAIAYALSSPVGVGSARFRTSAGVETSPREVDIEVDTVAFGAYPIRVLRDLGGFDASLVRNQDDDLNDRLRRAGGTVLLVPDALVRYRCRGDFPALWRQYREFGWWKAVNCRRSGRLTSLRALAPAALVLALVGSVAGAAVAWPWIGALGLLMPVGVVGAYLGGIALAAMLAPSHRHLVLRALATLHLAYGIGFWTGLFRLRPLATRAP